MKRIDDDFVDMQREDTMRMELSNSEPEHDEGSETVAQPYDRVIHFTMYAVLLQDGTVKYWLPRSQIEEDPQDEDLHDLIQLGEPGEFRIPRWLSEDKTVAEDKHKKKRTKSPGIPRRGGKT